MALKFLDGKPLSKSGRPRTLLSDSDMEQMKARPGEWALVAKKTFSPGSFQNYRKFGFRVSQRQNGVFSDGFHEWKQFDVYMQWPVGGTEPEARPASIGTEVVQRYEAGQNVSITTKHGNIRSVTTWTTGVSGSTKRTFSIKTR